MMPITERVEVPVEGVVVLADDDPSIRKGSSVKFWDARCQFSGIVVRRRRQRDGSLKLWITAVAIRV